MPVGSISFAEYVRQALVTGTRWFVHLWHYVAAPLTFFGVVVTPAVLFWWSKGKVGLVWVVAGSLVVLLFCALVGAYRMHVASEAVKARTGCHSGLPGSPPQPKRTRPARLAI